jgi:phosphoribosylaminoimidazole-succinocarboxamide synthase
VIAPIAEGKVREIYSADPKHLVLVTSDRISAYDEILPTEIPDKGRLLNALSVHWFSETEHIVPNHLVGWHRSELPREFHDSEMVGRAMLVRRLDMLPVECVARGYLAGSGWRDYRRDGSTSGHALPEGLRLADRLPEPVFAPATKATEGHDQNIGRDEVARLVGAETAHELERLTLAVYAHCAARCAEVGIILADTKLEFGRDADGRLVLADEVVTPDSSRFWPAGEWVPGSSPPSFDKQFVRDHLDALGWDRTPPAPALDASVVRGTRRRYVEAYERIAGRTFASYMEEATR